jgi:membrane protein YqaA with SNARE-associated domain
LIEKLTQALVAFGPWGILILGFVDSAGVPVSAGMDALVILVAIEDPEAAWFGAAMAVIGSVFGNVALFLAARRGGRRFASASEGRSYKFRLWFHRYGLVTVFIPALVPFPPLPLKVFVISAGALRVPLASFIVVTLLARIPRYFGEAYIAIRLGQESTRFLTDHAWHLFGMAVVLCLFLFGIAKLVARYRRPAEELGIRPPEG